MLSDQSQVWIAVYTRPRWEKTVAAQLHCAAIETYVPIRHELRQWSDRKKVLETPLLPSYVLVRLTPSQYQRVYQADGVVRVVMFRGRVAIVQQQEIDLLRRIEQAGQPLSVSSNLFRANEEVQITSGAFQGLHGRVIRSDGTCRVVLEIHELSFAFVVDVPCSCLEPLSHDLHQVA